MTEKTKNLPLLHRRFPIRTQSSHLVYWHHCHSQCCQHRSAINYLFFNVLICSTPCTVITLITLVHLFVKLKLCIKTVLKSITPSEITALIHTTLSYIWKLNFCNLQKKWTDIFFYVTRYREGSQEPL